MTAERVGKKKVLFVSHSAQLYGAERSLLTLILGLQEKGYVEPAVLLPGEGALADSLRASGIKPIVLRYRGWIRPRRNLVKAVGNLVLNLIFLLSLAGRLRLRELDVVYSNTLVTPFGAMLSLLFRLPHVWHVRELVREGLRLEYDLGTRVSMALVNRSARVVCNSFALRDGIAGSVDEDKLEVIYNGFEFPRVTTDASTKYDRCVLGAEIRLSIMGSVQPYKGQEDAVRALSVLKAKGYPVRLSVAGAGDGKYISRLKLLCRELSVEDDVVWHGFVEHTADLLADTAVALVCSRLETFGRAAVEAMATRTPVVCASSGGLLEVVEDGATGLLYRPGDHMELANGIERLLVNRDLYEGIAQRGRGSVVAKFGIDSYVSNVHHLLGRIRKPAGDERLRP